jgi:hypothetical protein
MFLRFGVFLITAFLSTAFLTTVDAQNFSVGLIGGGAVTNAFDTDKEPIPHFIDTYSQSSDYLVGLTLEYHLPRNFSIELDGLYRELHLTVAQVEPNLVLNSVSPSPVVTWELPVLAKYRFHWSKFDPFIEAGPEFRTTGNLNANPSHYGVAVGVGVTTHWKGFEISPVVRYTRWAHDQPVQTDESKSDQLELLVGISRRPEHVWHPLGPRLSLGAIAGATLIHDVSNSSSTFILVNAPAPGGGFQQEPGTSYTSGKNAFLAGPSLEVALPGNLYVQLDAVNHPIRSSGRSVLDDGTPFYSFSGTEASSWEFPVLGKYKFGAGRFKPFAEAGPAFRTPAERSSVIGVAAEAGVEVRLRRLKIAPGIRYYHWKQQAAPLPPNEISLDQVEFLTEFLL